MKHALDISQNQYKWASVFIGPSPEKLGNKSSQQNEELKDFYINLHCREYKHDITARKDDIKRKSTGFYN